ncbi:probable flavin-containing monoamine oxidase A [Diadema antillarum]|uniref:probable flavin-containing monoamine oxidase A n=1 Tax=Diadema antillarum TaxID=105358 RepID=UPI003A882863
MAQPEGSVTDEYDVIVIGAGLAGLTAAYHLTKTIPGCKVAVLEAKDRVGGRTHTVTMQGANGPDTWDLGGQWVSSTQHHILWLLKELGMEHYPQFTKGRKLQQYGANHRVQSFEGEVPAFSIFALLDLMNFEWKTDSLAKTVPCHAPWKAPDADHYDNMTFETYVAQNTWTKSARDLIGKVFYAVNGSEERGYSALNYLFYLNSGISNRMLYFNEDGAAQESRIKGGAQTVSKKLAEKIGSSNLHFTEPVLSIDQSDAEVDGKVKVQTLSGKTFSCKYVISAMPTNCAVSVQYSPVPIRRQTMASYMRMGNLFKFIITYKTAFWREKGFSGEIMNFCKEKVERGSYAGPVMYVADCTTSNESPGLVGFYNNAAHWGTKKYEERKAAVLEHVAVFLGPEAKSPIEFRDKDWITEPYNGGCPVNLCMTGAAEFWDAIREPFGRIHWAGTETATYWNGYLSGAVQSGLRAADEVASRLDPKQCPGVSDVLRSLDDLSSKDRKQGKGNSSWWMLGMIAVGMVILALFIAQVWK